MVSLSPIYTNDNCKVAYQLNWSLSAFWKESPEHDGWLPQLRAATETDGIRILEHRFATPTCSMFLVSTLPHVKPVDIPRLVKGRLQYIVRDRWAKAFQRNYDLRSIGSARRDKVEAYVASQIEHHAPGDDRMRAILEDLQIMDPEIDLSQPKFSAHARFWCNLHLVFVHDWRWCVTEADVWVRVRDMIRRVAASKGHLLSRVGIVPDHLHITMGTNPDEAPIDISLAYMNNLAFVHGMKRVFMHSCFVGTFGEYDLGAIKHGNPEE